MRWKSEHNRLLVAGGLVALIAAVGVFQVRAIGQRDVFNKPYHVGSGQAILPPLPQSTFIRSYPMKFNGKPADFAHYSSALSAEDVVRRYIESLASDLRQWVDPKYPVVQSMATGCSVFSFARKDGSTVGVIAFDNKRGGSHYFVGDMPLETAKPIDGDCPGSEPDGVVKPLNATRKLCIENLGGVDSTLLCYDAWGRPSDIAESMRDGLAENGWHESGSSATLSKNYSGHALLSFSRGREQCIVGIDQDPKSGKIMLLVLWCDRPWFPEGTAL